VRDNPAVYPDETALGHLEWMMDVGDTLRLYDRAWTELKMK
jgi:spermidine/putrescine transport system substrate-binding protein